MKNQKSTRAVLKKQIPTLLGLGVLIVALVAGLLFFGDGTGVFAPRATPQTTPKNIHITNVTDKSFTVSFYTDEATPGFVKYGESVSSVKNQMGDDRDQLSGVVSPYSLHHVTVRGLKANSNYFYVLGTGSNSTFDDNGAAFQIKTAVKSSSPPPASKTIYGSVSNSGGTPAEGSIIYLTIPGVGDLSSQVRSSGSWNISLANARTADGSAYGNIGDDTSFSVVVQGSVLSQTTSFTSTVATSQPMQDLVLGQKTVPEQAKSISQVGNTRSGSSEPFVAESNSEDVEDSITEFLDLPDEDEIIGGGLTDLVGDASYADASEEASIVEESIVSESTASASFDLTTQEGIVSSEKVVTTSKPLIAGRVAPNVQVTISVHSDTQIEETVTSDENGDFELDLSQFGEGLEPGNHTVTYSYIDPDTGEKVEATYDFVVEDTSNLLAQANTSGTDDDIPYGSGNPYSPTATPTQAVATESATATRSAIVSTESSILTAGSVGTTMALVLGGLFFIFTGAWSWWLAGEVGE